MRVLELNGIVEQVVIEKNEDYLQDIARMLAWILVFFMVVALLVMLHECCIFVKHWLFVNIWMKVSNFLSPPPWMPPDEPLVDPDQEPPPPPFAPPSDIPVVYLVQVPLARSFKPPSDEHQAEMEGIVQRAEEICEGSGLDIPEAYLCPISGTVMVTPVMTDTGHTYDLKNLQTWFQEKNTCPITNEPTIIVARNLVCERIIEEWAKKVTDKGMEDVLTPAPEQDSVSIYPPVRERDSLSMDLMVELRGALNRKFASVSRSDEDREGEWD
jgi:hypothetical protein